jgi:hypothetical protein
MIFTQFTSVILSLVGAIVFVSLWLYYYTYTNTITTPKISHTDVYNKKTTTILHSLHTIIFGLFIFWVVLFNYSWIQKLSNHNSLWDAIYISNNTTTYLFILLLVFASILSISTLLFKQNVVLTSEYLIFVGLIVVSSYVMIGSTSLFLAIFSLEFVALLIFGKFVVSRSLVTTTPNETKLTTFINQFSYGLFNSLFFQFWANFVSSVILFFSLSNIHYLFGLSNFYMVNFFFYIITLNWYVPEVFGSFILTVLITGFFIKLGLSPYQFFKIETYKGIPLYMVVIYTVLYLIVYVYFFIFIFLCQLTVLKEFTGSYILFILFFSVVYLFSLLFDTKNFKAFLSYSTLITLTNLFLVILII